MLFLFLALSGLLTAVAVRYAVVLLGKSSMLAKHMSVCVHSLQRRLLVSMALHQREVSLSLARRGLQEYWHSAAHLVVWPACRQEE